MTRTVRAELLKLRRPAIVYSGIGVAVFAVLATVLIFVTAGATSAATFNNGPALGASLAQLGQDTGMVRGFTVAAGFLGLAIFVLFLTSVTGEYGQGTIRTLLTRQPQRTALLGGKLLALLVCTAGALLVAELAATGIAIPLAHLRGVPTTDWFTGAGLSHAAASYGNGLLTAVCYGTVGAAIGVLCRSTPLALGIGIAWLGPLEHIVQLSWTNAGKWFPGLLFDTVASGGTPVVSYTWALTLALAFTAVAAISGTVSFVRSDVTA
jgi:ABC-2 type transport system permease protein